ncbi:MAG TPA: TetR/AcrR family transcriptional regulator [Marmoricola sp.]|nr:TetR/AcrR family transcriptional regulator [Marmoricola sp.]
MPKIEAATVAEHREMRHRAVVENAVRLYLDAGPSGVTPAAVAAATGLARSSVYQYFATSGELIGAAVEQLFSDYTREVVAAVEAVGPDPRERLAAYVQHSLSAANRNHTASMNAADLPEECRDRLAQLHQTLRSPLRAIIAESGVANVDLTTALAMGAIQGAVIMVDHGAPVEHVVGPTVEFVARNLA